MGYLLLSVQYPSKAKRREFFRDVGPGLDTATSSLHPFLPASIDEDGWKRIVQVIKSHANPSILNKDELRPLKPNDDNYALFVGQKWKPESFKESGNAPPELLAFLGNKDAEPIPHYERCANCTNIASKKCSKCKFVMYCSRECQTLHWKNCHKESCLKANTISLINALQFNDGFRITAEECREIADALKSQANWTQDPLITSFAMYFDYVVDLDGCFVL